MQINRSHVFANAATCEIRVDAKFARRQDGLQIDIVDGDAIGVVNDLAGVRARMIDIRVLEKIVDNRIEQHRAHIAVQIAANVGPFVQQQTLAAAVLVVQHDVCVYVGARLDQCGAQVHRYRVPGVLTDVALVSRYVLGIGFAQHLLDADDVRVGIVGGGAPAIFHVATGVAGVREDDDAEEHVLQVHRRWYDGMDTRTTHTRYE